VLLIRDYEYSGSDDFDYDYTPNEEIDYEIESTSKSAYLEFSTMKMITGKTKNKKAMITMMA